MGYTSALRPEHGDCIIIGASRYQQLEETLRAIEDGPLDVGIAKRIDSMWDKVKQEAQTEHNHLWGSIT